LKDASPEIVKNTLIQVHEKGFFYDQLVVESIMKANDLDEEEQKRKKRESLLFPNGKATLTTRETEFIKNSCSEMTYKEIADVMGISERTVDGYRESVFSKLDIKSRTGLVLFAIQSGIISLK
jgi:DNA-binding NarL/FixJ family response regulator